ncbi:hypothetical protein BGAL_0514g00010 [Botrytis galanthina]|uniref:Uncharacterized protein n=1 Tax=Botrytis galanthina TaxID=278940 RepID=A0A4S8QK39_9HELO|nr:hypothetical protein BGAL_0514g00010 [Botrytis galanthina]
MTKYQLRVFNDQKQAIICNECLFWLLFSAAPLLLISLLLWIVPTNRPDTSTEIIYPTITHSESWNYQSRPPYGYTLRKSQFSPRQIEWGNDYILPLTRFIFSGVIWEEWLLGILFWTDLMFGMTLVLLVIIQIRRSFEKRKLDVGENMGAGGEIV